MLAIHFGIDVSVDEQEIRPAAVIEIEKHGAPAEILRVQAEAGVEGDIVKGAVPIVAVERGSIVGKIGFKNVQVTIAVEIGNGRTHAGLFFPIFVEGGAGEGGYVGKGAVAIVAVENAGGAVASDVDVRPAVFVEIERGNAESVVAIGLIDVRFLCKVFKGAVAAIVVEEIRSPG